MAKSLFLGIGIFLVFGVSSFASAGRYQAQSPIHSWENIRLDVLPESSPEGYTYIYNSRFPINGLDNCDDVFKKMDEALESTLFYDGPVFGTSFMYCGTDPSEKPLELFVQVGAEPNSATEAGIQEFNQYISRVQGKEVLGTQIQYQLLDKIIARTDLQATLVWDPAPNQAIFHHSEKYELFKSLGAFYRYQRDNRNQFWTAMDNFLDWVEKGWGLGVRKIFQYYALPKVNSITLDYERNYLMKDQSMVRNWLTEVGLFRDCRKNENKLCL